MKNEFEIYDSAIAKWVLVTLPGEPKPIPIVIATGHRGFQRIEYLYKKQDKRITLPCMAVVRNDIAVADDRFRFHPRMKVKLTEDLSSYYVTKYPQPIDIPYTIDIRAVKEDTLNYIRTRLTLLFVKDIGYVNVNLEDYGDKILSVKLDSFASSKELEPGESDIKLRETVSMTLRGYLFRGLEEVGLIESSSVSFLSGENDVLEVIELKCS